MYIDFTICSEDINFKELKQLFNESNVIYKGELLRTGKRILYNEFSILFEQKDEDVIYYIDDLIISFKEYIGCRLGFLFDYIKINKLKSSFCIVIKEGEEKPAISITNENLLFLYKLNADIDFDFI